MEKIIYDNYNTDDLEKVARENLIINGFDEEDITDEMIFSEINFISEDDWDYVKYNLDKFFNGNYIAVGICGRWNGTFTGGFIFNTFEELLENITKDCEYLRIWEDNGHFYLRCAHHDGTNEVEVKEVSDKGMAFYDNWAYDYSKKYDYSERICHQKMWKNNTLTRLPRFLEKYYAKA